MERKTAPIIHITPSSSPASGRGTRAVGRRYLVAIVGVTLVVTGSIVSYLNRTSAASWTGATLSSIVEARLDFPAPEADMRIETSVASPSTAPATPSASPPLPRPSSEPVSLQAVESVKAVAAPSPPAAPSPGPDSWRAWALRDAPAEPTPFPSTYVSKLVRAARAESVTLPDVLRRGRALAGDRQGEAPSDYGGCPPYHGPVPPTEDVASDALLLDVLGRYRVSLVTVSYMSPLSLAGAAAKWEASGLLDLMDDKVMWLNAPLQREIDIGLRLGFKVLPSFPDVINASVVRTTPLIDKQYRDHEVWPQWPYTQKGEGGLTSLWVAPSLLLAQYETSAEVTLFLEKDYVVNPMPRKQLIRDLLASVALLHYNTSVVRIRKRDDPERGSIPNICGELHHRFSQPCTFNSHLAWLYSFCAPDERRIEADTGGKIKMCYDEADGRPLPGGSAAAVAAAIEVAAGRAPVRRYTARLPPRAFQGTRTVPPPGMPVARMPPREPDPPTRSPLPLPPLQTAAVVPTTAGVSSELDPLRIHCFSFDWSGWSNNAALFLRQWWLHNLDDAAILTRDGNGMFEVNAMLRCRKKGAQAGGVGVSLPPHVCQLFNGIVNHEEIDQ